MTCAKRRVVARLLAAGGQTWHGENLCRHPQRECPRVGNQGYEKCHTICRQPWHAETAAIYACLRSGHSPEGGHMIINHDPCQECIDVMRAWHMTWTVV